MADTLSEFQRRYQALQQQFHARLPARLTEIIRLGEACLAAETVTATNNNFQLLVHNLAGSAGSYNFPEITLLCQQIEDALRKQDPASGKIIRAALDQLQTFI